MKGDKNKNRAAPQTSDAPLARSRVRGSTAPFKLSLVGLLRRVRDGTGGFYYHTAAHNSQQTPRMSTSHRETGTLTGYRTNATDGSWFLSGL